MQTNQATIFRGPQLGPNFCPVEKPETRAENKASSLAKKFKDTMANQLADIVDDYLACGKSRKVQQRWYLEGGIYPAI